ncbi:bifunctional homocysteine S-methyltransferase/methylenetetrahydrofolate reductase [Agaribacter marinus]|uniref:Bifunctional homocysteine S-methyltransferase/methylenetetrahydrofolate reductase n=2 Tax=Bacillati TaxID=1783272 RepID=A0A941DYW0_9BACI|nr:MULTISPECIES: bifunctional homocysteine S-methyltransferase/methylenetetrahydrofolate reductase [Bacillaceae]MBR7795893.1 bifunctional homocysteine S-methyltransferase/methylenetetrahydrofolate reductase [Virgibacillus salarius]NAZ08605.1 bifunctional homocysteine S-methyltransferase/methylenetetrahydrofolate reductase [Agaribacter marinus]
MDLLTELDRRILIGDGAMGSLLYSYGVDHCFEELNLTLEEQIAQIHQAYIHAGADLIQTNTYGANYIKLARYGLEDQVKKINTAAIKIAKQTASEDVFVLGTIGGIHGTQTLQATNDEIKRSFREQLYCLLLEGVDGLILETYYDLEELTTVLEIAREETALPIIANVSMHEAGILQNGIPLPEALQRLQNTGADIVGINCRLGPFHMLDSLKEVPLLERSFLAAYPNASLPAYRDGKLIYENEPDYFKSCAKDFRNEGVRLLGGCCGTTPAHIQAIAEGVKDLEPLQEKEVIPKAEPIEIRNSPIDKEPRLIDMVKQRHSIIVEFDAPKHLDTEEYLEGIRALDKAGIDAITLADNSLATPRISNIAIAAKIKQEIGIKPLVHLTCRDRNLIGLQSHLMGLHALEINEILAITGDPTKIGDFPGATSVFDLTSLDLIKLIKQFNQGLSFSGKSLRQPTKFQVGAAFNPNVARLDKAVKRMERKIDRGADYFLTQPIYSKEKIIELAEETHHIDKPIYVGIMPLTSTKNAEFLHNEVPGIKMPEIIRQRMKNVAVDKQQSIKQGIEIAKELLDTALTHFQGIYLVTPFMRYDISIQLVNYIHKSLEINHSSMMKRI